jgi:hypothetical protein
MEKRANIIYNLALKDIVKMMGKNSTTYSDEIERVGKGLFGSDFRGVFPADMVPRMRDGDLAVVNLDKRDMPGSHWISIAKESGKLHVYDSFGRKSTKIIPDLIGKGKIVDADYDAEQKIKEDNCGQRSLSWLFVFKHFGKDLAMLI